MANYRTSRTIPTILTIIIIIVAIAGIVTVARLIFGGGDDSNPIIDNSKENLLSTSSESAVSMTVRGPIVADEDFRSYQIVISPSSRDFRAYTGYLDVITNTETLSNNTAAYDQFVNALYKANLIAGTPFEGEKNNVLGVCATGKVYEFSLLKDSKPTETLWTSTCSGSPGSLKASAAQLAALFLNQIPTGSDIAETLKL